MDNEYLQNVLGSPYVNEGAFDRLKAKGAQTIGGMGAMAGYQVQNPYEIKLKSLWGGFMSSLEKVMTDWKSQVSPMLGTDVKLDATSRQIRKNLDTLAQTLTPYDVGAYSSSVKPNPSALKTLTKEGMWDAAKRSMGLNKALSSNNPTTITNSYKNYVLSLFQNFMKDAIKSTGFTAQQVYKTLAKIQPKENGWQAAGNMQKVVKQLQKLQGAPKPYNGGVPPVIQPTAGATPPPLPPSVPSSPSVPPPLPSVTPQAQLAQPSPIPPVAPPIAPQPSGSPSLQPVIPPSPQPSGVPTPNTPMPSGGAVGDNFDIPPQDMPYVVLKAMHIIIDAARSDEAHALGLFGVNPHTKEKIPVPNLSTGWGSGASVTSSLQENHAEPHEGPTGVGYVDPEVLAKKAEDDKWIHKEYPGEFLYNFHSRYNKYPAQPFSIQVVGTTEQPEIKDAAGNVVASVEVWWQGNGTFNKIYAIEIKNGKKSKHALLLRFSDHHVNAKSGATTPGNPNFFDFDKVLQKSNPTMGTELNAAPKIKQEIDKLKDNVLRALLATTHRKTMEFVSRGWADKKAAEKEKEKAGKEMPTSTIDPNGTINYVDSASGKTVTVTKEQLKTFLKGPMEQAKAWRDRLESINYFDKFPDMPMVVNATPIWKEAHQKLVSKGHTPLKAEKLLGNGWLHIKSASPNASVWADDATLSSDDLVAAALKQKPTSPTETMVNKVPAALDAAKALITLGHKKEDAFSSVAQAITAIGADKTTEEYVKAATAKPKPTEPQKPVEPPKPVAPQPPKFKVGDMVDVGNTNFKIKSISQNNVVVTDTKGTEFAIPSSQWSDWEKTGAIKPAKANPVSGNAGKPPEKAPVTALVSAPVSGPAPTTNPTAPVSNAGKQQAGQPQKPPQDVGKLSIGNGKLIWTVGNDVQQLDVAQVKSMLKKANFKAAVKANPDVYQKFKDTFDTGGKGKTQEGIERVNPFRWENFV